VIVVSVVAVAVLARGAGGSFDQARAAVVGIAVGNTAGMLVAGTSLLVAVRRAGGAAAVAGVPRAIGVAALAAVAGALRGRPQSWLAEGAGIVASVAAGVAAGAVAAIAFALVVALADRRDAAALAARFRRRS